MQDQKKTKNPSKAKAIAAIAHAKDSQKKTKNRCKAKAIVHAKCSFLKS